MEPLRLTSRSPEEVKKVDFFELDGTRYQLPEDVGSSVVLSFLEELGAEGETVATARAFVRILGQETLNALKRADVPDEQFTALMHALRAHLMGATEGKARRAATTSSNGSAKSAG